MAITFIRVVHQQTTSRSILIDKLDDGQANTEGYAHLPRQPRVYIPYWNDKTDSNGNLIDSTVKGYIDLYPSDQALLSANNGTIALLAADGAISTFAFSSTLSATPVISAVSHVSAEVTIAGTTFLSVTPDKTYAILTNASGVSQTIPSSSFTSFTTTQIVIPDSAISGTPVETWTVQIKANSKLSNVHPLRNIAVISTVELGAPTAGDLTISGVDFSSVSPATSSVVITGTAAVTLTRAAILAGGGTFTDSSIVIPAALVPGIAETTSLAAVTADGFTSTAVAVSVRPTLASAVLSTDLTCTGTKFLSTTPAVSSVVITGDGAVTLTRAAIVAGSGTFTETSIVIPAALIPGVTTTTSSAKVVADGMSTSTVVIT